MKKVILISGIVILALVILTGLSAAGYALARAQSEPTPTLAPPDLPESDTSITPYSGMLGGFRQGMPAMRSPMMGWESGELEEMSNCTGKQLGRFGPLCSYLVNAIAAELGLTPDELQAQFDSGKTFIDVAKEKGLNDNQIEELFDKAHSEALKKAVAAGEITLEQADLMTTHMDQMGQNGEYKMGWWAGSFRGFRTGLDFAGLFQEYRFQALAEALGMTPEEIQTRLAAGETAWHIAQDKGMTAEQFRTEMIAAAKKVINQALADGNITQEQADWLISRVDTFSERNLGSWSDRIPGPRGRWFRQP